jgi:hypothetical protein
MKNFLTLFVLALSCSLLVANGANIQEHLSKRAIKPKTRSNALGGMLRQKQAHQSDDMGMAKKQCDAEKEHLQTEIDELRNEIKALKSKNSNVIQPGRVCCMALTASCMSCSAGISVEAFCKQTKNKNVIGCKKQDSTALKDNKPRMCCKSMSAKCIACSKGITVEELCEGASNMIPGCSGVEKNTKVMKPPAVDEDETEEAEEAENCQSKVENCCKSKFKPSCVSCRARNKVNALKYELCTKNKALEGTDDNGKDENPDDDEENDAPLEEQEKPKRPSSYDGPCMFNGKEDKGAPFCHDYDRMWGMPSDYDPKSKPGTSLLEVGEPKNIKWVVDLVKQIETAYPKDNWKTLATRLRKIVYFGKLWDMLIPKAKKTEVLAVKGAATQDVIKSLTTPNLNVRDPTGQQIDLNHVWVGIDVANYPATNLAVRILGGLKGPAVATWAGDVGSVLGEYYYRTQGAGDLDRYYEIMSGDDDMYSNADGYGIALQKLPSGSRNWKLSKRIEHYYANNINKRVTYMCDASGIKFKKRGKSKGKLTWNSKRKVKAQIRRFAKLWRIHQCPHGWKKCVIPTSKDPLHQKPTTVHTAKMGKTYLKSERDAVTNKFIKWLETHLKKEN